MFHCWIEWSSLISTTLWLNHCKTVILYPGTSNHVFYHGGGGGIFGVSSRKYLNYGFDFLKFYKYICILKDIYAITHCAILTLKFYLILDSWWLPLSLLYVALNQATLKLASLTYNHLLYLMASWGLGCVILQLYMVLVGLLNSTWLAARLCWKVKDGSIYLPGILVWIAWNLVL